MVGDSPLLRFYHILRNYNMSNVETLHYIFCLFKETIEVYNGIIFNIRKRREKDESFY